MTIRLSFHAIVAAFAAASLLSACGGSSSTANQQSGSGSSSSGGGASGSSSGASSGGASSSGPGGSSSGNASSSSSSSGGSSSGVTSSSSSSSGGASSGSSSSGTTVAACSARHAFAAPAIERQAVTHYGRHVTPLGHLTDVGSFSGGGQLTPDGRFYWAVDTGKDINYVWVVEVASGTVVQQIPLPGSGGHVVFSPDGKTAYVPGNPSGRESFPKGTQVKATAGDAIHVFAIDPATGLSTEQEPIAIPSSANPLVAVGSSRQNTSLVAGGGTGNNFSEWPEDIALSPDGRILLAALLNSDRAAIVNTATRSVTVVTVGTYPRGAAIERSGRYGYISNSNDGSLSKIDLAAGRVLATIPLGLGGEDISDAESGLLALAADPTADRLYASVANRDLVMVLDTTHDSVLRRIDLRRFQGQGGLGVTPDALAVTADGCTLYAADAYDNAVVSIALKDRGDSAARAYDVIGAIPAGDYPTAVAVSPDGSRLLWLAGKGMGVNKGLNGSKPLRNKQFWQRGIVGVLARPDDAYFTQAAAAVLANLTPDAESTPAATVVHGAATGPFNFAPSAQIKYVFLVVKENRTYDNVFGSLLRGEGAPKYELYDDNCGPANTAFESADRKFPGCGITPNAHALVRRWPLLTQFYANSEQSEEGHVFSTGGFLTDYTQRNSHWEPAGRGRPYDTGLYPITYPPKYFLFDQLLAAGVSFRNFGERGGGVNPEPKSQGANRSLAQFLQIQAATDATYPFNGLAACLDASATVDPAPLFAGCIFDSSARGQLQAGGVNVPPAAGVSREQIFETEFAALNGLGQWPRFAYVIQFNDHGQGNTTNNTTEPAQAADNDLALGELVDIVSHSAIWAQSAIFVMEDDSQDGGDHVDSHRMPAYVISPWAKQGKDAASAPIVGRRYDQLSMLRTIQVIFGLPPSSLLHSLATPMYDAFIGPGETPDTRPYTAILPERSLIEQNGKTAASRALARNAPQLYRLSQALPWKRADAVPQELADRIHYANIWGDDRHYPGPGPNASPLERQRAQTALRAYAEGRGLDALPDEGD